MVFFVALYINVCLRHTMITWLGKTSRGWQRAADSRHKIKPNIRNIMDGILSIQSVLNLLCIYHFCERGPNWVLIREVLLVCTLRQIWAVKNADSFQAAPDATILESTAVCRSGIDGFLINLEVMQSLRG